MTKIYTLSDPETGKVRYVGKTKGTLKKRLSSHISLSKKDNNYNMNWIRSLSKAELIPIIELIEEVEDCNWEEAEIYWIEQFRQWGFKLTNFQRGGVPSKERYIQVPKEFIEAKAIFRRKPIKMSFKNGIHQKYESLEEAVRETGVNRRIILSCCRTGARTKERKMKFEYIINHSSDNIISLSEAEFLEFFNL